MVTPYANYKNRDYRAPGNIMPVTNPIESSFATIRHRTDQTKGAVSRSTLLGLVYKLAMCAENSFRRLNGFNRLAEVIRGVRFVDGVREEESVQQKVAA